MLPLLDFLKSEVDPTFLWSFIIIAGALHLVVFRMLLSLYHGDDEKSRTKIEQEQKEGTSPWWFAQLQEGWRKQDERAGSGVTTHPSKTPV